METLSLQAKKVMKAYPDKPAVKFRDITITYSELYDRAMAMASFFKSQGLKKGDRFAVLMSNRHEHVELDLAAAFGGFVKVPLNYRLHPKEHEYMINDAQLSVVIGEKELIEPINLPFSSLFIGNDYDAVIQEHLGHVVDEEVEEDDLFAIMYTSGTTGNPKGVMLSHRNMLAGALSLSQICEVTNRDVIGHVAPLTHGSNFLSHVSWLHGNTQVVYNKFSPEEFIDDIEKDQVSVIFLVPTMVNLMIQHPDFDPEKLKSIKSINMAGSPIAASKLQLALEKLGTKFVETYGQVEAPMCITVMPRDEIGNRLESAGRTGPFVDMEIIDSDGNELPSGEVGEIVCKGSLVMQGYWNNEEATNKTLQEGWLYTGDLGWVDEQDYLHIVDRIKDVIISGGVNIYPREVEEVLNKHEGIKETCVIGIPDNKWGESVVAYVVPNGTTKIEEEELIALCKEHLASFKKPKDIRVVDQLPKSSYGKILKRELRKKHLEEVTK
ncbi:class I adenylate-forming enzyme family protein [Tenuibacillus multivorans]|uniref:Long-chain acyl-CoA synthetase n=1 Tax=Tenuibacillus multivorans TaxID=237069 RepID=A0A1H0BZI4_9BACI|nr:AMP-binding protein [Tenuibacillus multivorans]GEL78583.1 AMP-dependent synthetase [Tenuibacillus multivorans]SDN51044.1 long-chain acyl-CoA synthetase [Tenuibacillus multivorans]